jgi:hypothetical protein
MATIAFTHMQGELPAFAPELREITREGQDGQRWKDVGRRGRRVSVRIYALCADDTAWTAYDVAARAAVGGEHTLSNSVESWTRNVIVHSVTPDHQKPKTVVTAGSASANTRLWSGVLEVTPTA